MSCPSSQLLLDAASSPPQTTMSLELYFSRLMLRELQQFRNGTREPAEDGATEVARHDPLPPFPNGQDSTAAHAETTEPAIIARGDEQQQATAEKAPGAIALFDANEAANDVQGKPVRLITIPNTTDRQRRNNGARQQRVYRLAQKFGVSPGGPRWTRNGRPHMQPAVPRSAVRADGTVEYNQFMHDGGAGEVVLRMPGGWKRGLVRDRPQFMGVAVIDGFLWPRFSPNLPRGMTVDWEDQGFVEFNEVRYTTPFAAREPKPAPRGGSDEKEGILIDFEA